MNSQERRKDSAQGWEYVDKYVDPTDNKLKAIIRRKKRMGMTKDSELYTMFPLISRFENLA